MLLFRSSCIAKGLAGILPPWMTTSGSHRMAMRDLPNRRDLRRADPVIPTHEGKLQRERCGGNYAVGKVRDNIPRDPPHGDCYLQIKRRHLETGRWIAQSLARQPGISGQVPQHRVGICHNGAHQISFLGKLPHISRRASAMSSSEIDIPWPAQSPSRLLRGRWGCDFLLRNSAKSNTSCRLSAGNAWTASRSDSSIVIRSYSTAPGRAGSPRHQISSRGKFCHISRRASTMSSSEMETPRPAHFSAGRSRRLSRMASLRLMAACTYYALTPGSGGPP